MVTKRTNNQIKKSDILIIFINILILISMIYGVIILPYPSFPAPFNNIDKFLTLGFLAVFVLRNKIPKKFFQIIKNLWFAAIAISILYVQYLAYKGLVDFEKTLRGDLFFIVIPLCLVGLMTFIDRKRIKQNGS